jgi:hypothetical protein
MGRRSAVGAKYPVPREVVTVFSQDAPYQPGSTRQAGFGGDVSVGEHGTRRDGRYYLPNSLPTVMIHRRLPRRQSDRLCHDHCLGTPLHNNDPTFSSSITATLWPTPPEVRQWRELDRTDV